MGTNIGTGSNAGSGTTGVNIDSNDKMSKYRTRMSNEKYFIKKVRQQSLQTE
jgi:hypothetical protein